MITCNCLSVWFFHVDVVVCVYVCKILHFVPVFTQVFAVGTYGHQLSRTLNQNINIIQEKLMIKHCKYKVFILRALRNCIIKSKLPRFYFSLGKHSEITFPLSNYCNQYNIFHCLQTLNFTILQKDLILNQNYTI
jgi:hypothetical protein